MDRKSSKIPATVSKQTTTSGKPRNLYAMLAYSMEPNYRRCLSCRQVAPKNAFWRVVRLYPSRQVQLDEGMGRSAYICPQASCLAAAQKKNRLGRNLRSPVPEEVYETLWKRLAAMPAPPTRQREEQQV